MITITKTEVIMNLLTFLKSEPDARKIFGKREIKIIEKQLQGVKLTQSEKNRLSRDIRRKLEFIEKASKFKSEFSLKKGSVIKNIINESIEIIKEDALGNKIEKIVLFGSANENKLTFHSDIDIAVEFSRISLKEATVFRKRVSGKINEKVDIQVYNLLPKKIKKGVERGRILWKKEGCRTK